MKFLSTQFERTSLCGSFLESKFSPVNPLSAWRIFEKGSDRLAKIHITPLRQIHKMEDSEMSLPDIPRNGSSNYTGSRRVMLLSEMDPKEVKRMENENTDPLKCPYCPVTFSCLENRRNHIKLHIRKGM